MTDAKATSFDTFQPTPVLPIFESLMKVERDYGVKAFRQIADILMVGIAGRRFAPIEYYKFGAFLGSREGRDAVRAYCGHRSRRKLNSSLNNPNLTKYVRVFGDKTFLTVLLAAMGLRVPETQALFHPLSRFGAPRILQDGDEIAAFLRNEARYPLFGKPVSSSLSLGIASIDGFDAAGDALELLSGERVPVETFVRDVTREYADQGYIFQSRIRQHPEVAHVCGDTVSTVRIVTLRETAEAEVLYAVWKIARRASGADNFWRNGNLLALLDPATGAVRRVQQGTGAAAKEVTLHPDSGVELIGRVVPNWDKVCADAVTAASADLNLRVLGWDIAIGPDGPIFVEANTSPDHSLYQIAAGRGIRNPEFQPRFARAAGENAATVKRLRAKHKAERKADRARDRAALVGGIDLSSVLKTGDRGTQS